MTRALVIAAALAAGACRDARLAELHAIRDEVCACKTAQCGQEALGRVPKGKFRSEHRAQKLARAMMECLDRLNRSERPSSDPDAEPPASPAAEAPPSAGAAPGAP